MTRCVILTEEDWKRLPELIAEGLYKFQRSGTDFAKIFEVDSSVGRRDFLKDLISNVLDSVVEKLEVGK